MHPKSRSARILTRPETRFPPATAWLVDELVPSYVKRTYSARESWKDKPFGKEDVHFFSKGLLELSELFTEERPSRIPPYFRHPKFRSAYLLYFLPLQLAKFITVLQLHPSGLDSALRHARKTGVLRVVDLGAGPGTASLAVLLSLLLLPAGDIPPVELIWLDSQRPILRDGEALVHSLVDQFPKLRARVRIRSHVAPWWQFPEYLPAGEPVSLFLLGHILNESRPSRRGPPAPELQEADPLELDPVWSTLFSRSHGGGILMIEPASRRSSQHLSHLRNQILRLRSEGEELSSRLFWGPCPHAGTCPLSSGRDYCHFSVPAQVPGTWFREFSKALGSERNWLKFSYLWHSAPDQPAPEWSPRQKLVISDPLGTSSGREVLICMPERPDRMRVGAHATIWRGEIVVS